MDRCALFVDAGYALADGAMAVHGTRRRDSVSWDHAGLLKLLAGLARDRTGLPVLRCYWYEAASEGRRTEEHDALAEMPGLKLRLVNALPGRREGIESQLRRDLVTLAKSGAISDAFIASANEHIAEIVSEVQDLGLRVVVLHIASDGGWTIPLPLRQECDDIVEISGVHLRSFVNLIKGTEAVADDQGAAGQYGSRGLMDGKGALVGTLAHAGLPMAALPASDVVYHVAESGEYRPNNQFAAASQAAAQGQREDASQREGAGQRVGASQDAKQASYPAASASVSSAQPGGIYPGPQSQPEVPQGASEAGTPVAQAQPGPDQSRVGSVGQPVAGQQAASVSPNQAGPADQSPYATAGYPGVAPQLGDGQNGYRNGAGQLGGPATADSAHRPSASDFLNSGPYQVDGGSLYLHAGSGGYQNGAGGNGGQANGQAQGDQGQAGQAQGSQAQGGPVQGGPVQGGPGQSGAPQNGLGQNGLGQNGLGQNGLGQNGSGPRDPAQQGSYQHDSMATGFGHNAGQSGNGQSGNGQNGNGQNGRGQAGPAQPTSAPGGYQGTAMPGPQLSAGQMPAGQNGAAQFGFATGVPATGQPPTGQSPGGQPPAGPPPAGPQGQYPGYPQQSVSPGSPSAGQPYQNAPLPGIPNHGMTGLNGNGNGSAHNGSMHNGPAHNGSAHNGEQQQGQAPGNFQSMLGQQMPGPQMPGQQMPGQPPQGHQAPGQLGHGQADPRGGDPYSHGLQQGQPAGFDPAPIPLPGLHSLSGLQPQGLHAGPGSPPSPGPQGPGHQGPGHQGPGPQGLGPHGQNGFPPQDGGYLNGPSLSGAEQALRAGFSQQAPGQLQVPAYQIPQQTGLAPHQGPGGQPSGQPQAMRPQPAAIALPDAVKAAHAEGFTFGESVGRDAPGLWLEAVLARKPRMPSDLEARLLQGSVLPIDSLLHDEVRHSLRRGFWDALESARR